MNGKLMEEAIRSSVDHESSWNRLLGPVHSRGPNSGVVRLAGTIREIGAGNTPAP